MKKVYKQYENKDIRHISKNVFVWNPYESYFAVIFRVGVQSFRISEFETFVEAEFAAQNLVVALEEFKKN